MSLAAVIAHSKTDREAWKYTNLAEVEKIFHARSKPLSSARRRGRENLGLRSKPLVFTGEVATGNIDKHFSLSRPTSPQPLSSQREERGFALFLNGVLKQNDGLFHDILSGNAKDGYRVTLADDQRLDAHLELLFLNEPGATPSEIATKLHVSLGANSHMTLIERHEAMSDGNIAPLAHTLETVIRLGENAELTHGKIVNGGGMPSIIHLSQTAVRVAKNASYNNFSLLRGGKLTRNEIDVTLTGIEANCVLQSAMLLRNNEHADTTSRVVHEAKRCASRQHCKSVIDGKARGVFKGKIVVNEGAQKTDGYQLCRALLLSREAEMDAKPELEIYADDVKCSHGCTVGDLDEEAMFYLRSRGIGGTEARALLIDAFVNELVDGIQTSALQVLVKEEVGKWLTH